jgi:HSP20 family protein
MSRNMLTLIDQLFDDGIRPITSQSLSRLVGTTPAINVREFADRYEITVTVPGIDVDKLEIEIDDNVLNVNYDHDQDKSEKDETGNLIRQEYSHFSFSRSVALPKNIDKDSVQAGCKKGILTIKINKLPDSQPRKINIQNVE